MRIHAYILCYNEEKILPFVLDYYSKYCEKIFLLDNESTDSSREIAAKYPKVTIFSWNSGDIFDDFRHVELKNNVYKISRGNADWVIVCDCDELLYGFDELGEMTQIGVTLPVVEGFNMISEFFPTYDGECITEKIKTGYSHPPQSKQIIFNPSIDIQFSLGAHYYSASGNLVKSKKSLKLLHYRELSFDYCLNRIRQNGKRIPESYKAAGINIHYFNPEEEMRINFNAALKNSKKII